MHTRGMERFTISLDGALADAFDRYIAERGYANRSEAVRDLIRAELSHQRQHSAAPDLHAVGSLSYVYRHRERELAERLAALHHDHHDLTLSTVRAHLDHEHSLETVLLRGPAGAVQRFADRLCAERGVHHGKLNLISAEAHGHPHAHPHADPHPHAPHEGTEDAHAHGQGPGPHLHLRPLT